MSKKCKNCGEELKGNFCVSCGQKADTRRITVNLLMGDVAYGITNANSGVIYTLKALFTRPGHMLKDYILGRRINYFRPFPMLIILAGVYGLVMHFIEGDSEFMKELSDPGNWTTGQYKIAGADFFAPILKWMVGSTTFGVIILLPFYALAMKWAFRKCGSRRYNYAECLYVSAYMASQRIIVSFLFIPLVFFPDSEGDTPGLFWKYMIYLVLAVWTFKQFFGIKLKKAIGRTLFMGVIMSLFILTAIIFISLIVVLVIYKTKGGS